MVISADTDVGSDLQHYAKIFYFFHTCF